MPARVAAPETPGKTPYNLILISLTNTRADHLGFYGYPRATSPRLDAFARKSLLFKNAFSHASWTLPVALSLFTSQYPFTHGMMNREETQPLPSTVTTFVDRLKSAGYTTAAFVGDRDYGPQFGHVSRFDLVIDAVKNPEVEDWKTYGVLEQSMPAAREWLRKNHKKKFCLLVQGYDTHCPFASPKEHNQFDPAYRGGIDFTHCYWTFERTRPVRRRTETGRYVEMYLLKTKPKDGEDHDVMFYPEDIHHMIALYDGEIRYADDQIGAFLDELTQLGLERNTIVMFYSDHGDMFGKHGRFMRGGPLRGTFYDDVLHIPLLIYHPDIAAKTVNGLCQVVDLAPTLLDMLGLPGLPSAQGKSLVPLITRDVPVNEQVFAGAAFTPSPRNPFFRYRSVILSVRTTQWKLIQERLGLGPGPQDTFELYNLQKDPEELNNIAGKQPVVMAELKTALATWLKTIKAESIVAELK